MKIRKIFFIVGLILIITGVSVVVWFFARNQLSQYRMENITEEFIDELVKSSEEELLTEEDKYEDLLIGNTTSVIEFPRFNNQRIAVKEGTTDYILSIAAGHMTNTEQVWGSSGTSAIAAHNDTFFKNVAKLDKGDKILVYTRTGIFEYLVYNKKTIEPTDLSVLNDIDGQKTLTLITCNFTGSKRIVVLAKGGEKIGEISSIEK